MLRECSLEELSDGRTYGINDMVRSDTGSCQGCYLCCTGMGQSIILDPLDVWNLKYSLGLSFQELLNKGFIELNMVDGLILPNLRMNDRNRCSFLDDNGRCSIHEARPGICRIFPLGRVYDGAGFSYFLQKNQCARSNLAKVKIKKWIDTPCLTENQEFISKWHYFIRRTGENNYALRSKGMGDRINEISMYILNEFFVKDIVPDEAVGRYVSLYNILFEKIDRAEESLK